MAGNQYGEIDGQTAAVATTRGLLNVALSNVLLNRVSNAVIWPPLHHLLHQMIACQTSRWRGGKAENSAWIFLLVG